MKTVAIIGAGPAGLVTAKTLLRSKSCKFNVTIFEKASEVGGLWGVHQERPYDGMLNPDMPTNLSRFNIGFSDLAWSSVGLQGHVPYWPRAWQVGQYLRAYTDRYIPKETILYNTRVTSAASADDEEHSNPSWRLRWETVANNGSSSQNEGVFDYLVVASGFFGTSSTPDFSRLESSNIKVVHSTKLRKLRDVLPDNADVTGTLLVVGGGMSGADASTVLASQLSDANNSPTGNDRKYKNLKLIQLCPEPAYALPLAAACDQDEPTAPHFQPLDLCMYRLDKRPPGPIDMKVGQMPADVIKTVHQAFQALVGNQSDLGVPGLTYKDASKAAYVTLTEQYSGFIRSGGIEIVIGRLQEFKLNGTSAQSDELKVSASYLHGEEQRTITDIVGIVYATGFTPHPSLEFISPAIRQALEHDANHNRLPVLLDEHATLSSNIPALAIIGFHEGAFWGSMEMEARLVERRWSGNTHSNGVVDDSKSTESLKSLRKAMLSKEKDVPQYWMGDYVGMMEQIARETGTTRNDLNFPERTGPVSHARYTDSTCDISETEKILEEYSKLLSESTTGTMFVGRAAFLALQGNWNMERTIISHLATMPSGTLSGKASFHPRFPTDPDFDFEYLYIENGTFTMNNGLTMNATRRYVYRYREETDKVTVWFVKDDGKTVDYMYHGLAFDTSSRKTGWLAKADHLCIADMYKSDYTFKFKGANLSTFGITHAVKGPKKDYVSETWYVR